MASASARLTGCLSMERHELPSISAEMQVATCSARSHKRVRSQGSLCVFRGHGRCHTSLTAESVFAVCLFVVCVYLLVVGVCDARVQS